MILGELWQLHNIQTSDYKNLWSLGKKIKKWLTSHLVYGVTLRYTEKARYIGSVKKIEMFVFEEILIRGLNTMKSCSLYEMYADIFLTPESKYHSYVVPLFGDASKFFQKGPGIDWLIITYLYLRKLINTFF